MSTIITAGSNDTVLAGSAASYFRAVAMSATKAIVSYRLTSDSVAYARCLDISGNAVSHPGAAISIPPGASNTYALDVVRLTDTKAVALYAYTSNRPQAVVLDLSGSTLTRGTEQEILFASGGDFTGVRLSDSSMLVTWTSGTSLKAVVLSGITGSTITVNTIADVEAATAFGANTALIDTSRVLLVYAKGGNLTAEVLDVSGTTVTGGNSPVTVASDEDGAGIFPFEVVVFSGGTKAAVAYRKTGSLDISINILTISGSSLTAGTAVNYPTLDASEDSVTMVALTDTENVLLTYRDYNDTGKRKAVIVSDLNTVLGTILTVSGNSTSSTSGSTVLSTSSTLCWYNSGANDHIGVVLSYDAPTPPVTIVPIPLPMITAAMRGGGNISATLPMFDVRMQGRSRIIDPDGVELPMLAASLRGGVRLAASLPMLTGQMSGTVTIMGRISATLPMLTGRLTGTVSGTGRMAVSLPMLTAAMQGGGALSASIPMLELSMTGTVGSVGRLIAELPMLTALLTGAMGNHGDLLVELPMIGVTPSGRLVATLPMLLATMTGRMVLATTYEAYAVNLNPSAGYRDSAVHEVTRFEDWNFDQVIRWRNRYYGVKADGLYLLGGDLDGAAAIAWSMHTGTSNLGSRQMKVVRELFVHGRVGPGLTAQASIGEAADVSYDAIVQSGGNAQATRAKLGRGLKAVYWSFGLADPDGGPADVDALQLDAAELSRKVF